MESTTSTTALLKRRKIPKNQDAFQPKTGKITCFLQKKIEFEDQDTILKDPAQQATTSIKRESSI